MVVPSFEKYGTQHDLIWEKLTHVTQLDTIWNLTKKPFLLDMDKYHAIRRNLNNEQQSIVKEIVARKKNNPSTPIHLFLTGGAGTGKTHTAKIAYDALLHFYDKEIGSDPLKKKGLKVAFTGKAAYNVGGVIVHSALRLPLNSSNMLPLNSNTLDSLTK